MSTIVTTANGYSYTRYGHLEAELAVLHPGNGHGARYSLSGWDTTYLAPGPGAWREYAVHYDLEQLTADTTTGDELLAEGGYQRTGAWRQRGDGRWVAEIAPASEPQRARAAILRTLTSAGVHVWERDLLAMVAQNEEVTAQVAQEALETLVASAAVRRVPRGDLRRVPWGDLGGSTHAIIRN